MRKRIFIMEIEFVPKAVHRISWGQRAAGTRRASWVVSATSCWTRTSPSLCPRPHRQPTHTRASPEREISVPSDVRWCCRVHPEARIWKFKDNVSHRGEIAAADSAPRKCICVSRASTCGSSLLYRLILPQVELSRRWRSSGSASRHHRLVGGFTVNIRAIRDTAEISVTCLAALIPGAATSCRVLQLEWRSKASCKRDNDNDFSTKLRYCEKSRNVTSASS